MEENLRNKILEDHANGITLSDIASKYDISASDLVNMILKDSLHKNRCQTPQEDTESVVKDDTSSNTEVQDDTIIESEIIMGQESLPKEGYRPNPNDIFMDLIIFGMDLNSVCFKYNLPEGDVGIILEDVYKEVSDKVVPMDDIKEAIKKICAEVYLARFN